MLNSAIIKILAIQIALIKPSINIHLYISTDQCVSTAKRNIKTEDGCI